MRKTYYALGMVICLLACSGRGPIAFPATRHIPNLATDTDVVAAIEGHTRWARMTRTPFLVSPTINAACAPATSARIDPHAGAYIDVYVNETGRAAMLTRGEITFPAGTVIVKEKRKEVGDSEPELMTVMVKRTSNYNPDAGDWEFAVVAGTGRNVKAQGKLTNCVECHKAVSKSDYVFRTYLARPE